MRRHVWFALACGWTAGVARAEPPVGAALPAPGHGAVAIVDHRSLATGTAGEPTALAFDGVIGVLPGLALGISHSAPALGEMGDGGGWCRDSDARMCPSLYARGYVDVRWAVPGTDAVRGLTRVGVDGTAPWKPVARLGVIARGARGQLWWAAQPEVAIALGNRGNGNRDALHVPAWLGVTLGPGAAWIESGILGPLDAFADRVDVRLGVGAMYARRAWALSVRAGFPELLGAENSTRHRVLSTAVTWSF